jgi:hypothetical protein
MHQATHFMSDNQEEVMQFGQDGIDVIRDHGGLDGDVAAPAIGVAHDSHWTVRTVVRREQHQPLIVVKVQPDGNRHDTLSGLLEVNA